MYRGIQIPFLPSALCRGPVLLNLCKMAAMSLVLWVLKWGRFLCPRIMGVVSFVQKLAKFCFHAESIQNVWNSLNYSQMFPEESSMWQSLFCFLREVGSDWCPLFPDVSPALPFRETLSFLSISLVFQCEWSSTAACLWSWLKWRHLNLQCRAQAVQGRSEFLSGQTSFVFCLLFCSS